MATATQQFTFNEVTHTYTMEGGIIVPSTTQVLQRTGYVDFSGVDRYVLERKAALGSAVHQITEYLDTEFADVPEDEIDLGAIQPEAAIPYVSAWLRFKRESEVHILGAEQRSIADINGMPVGMTFDREAIVNGRRAVLELKTAAQREAWWGLQLACYDMGMGELEGDQYRRDRYAVQLKKDGNYSLWQYDDEGEYDAFQWALATVWFQINHKYQLS